MDVFDGKESFYSEDVTKDFPSRRLQIQELIIPMYV